MGFPHASTPEATVVTMSQKPSREIFVQQQVTNTNCCDSKQTIGPMDHHQVKQHPTTHTKRPVILKHHDITMRHWTHPHCWRSQSVWWTQPLLSNCFKATFNIASAAQQISIDQQKKQIWNIRYSDRSTKHIKHINITLNNHIFLMNTQTQTTFPIAAPLHFCHWAKLSQSLQKPRRQRTWRRSTRAIESTVNTTLHRRKFGS